MNFLLVMRIISAGFMVNDIEGDAVTKGAIAVASPFVRAATPELLSGISCQADLDCADGNACTADLCASGGQCTNSRAGKIYWTDDFNDKIWRANLDGSDPETLISFASGTLGELIVDHDGEKIYWKQSEVIERANLDGTQIEALFGRSGMEQFALDLPNGRVYWTVQQPSGLTWIQRAYLDGTGEQNVQATYDLFSGLAIDSQGGKMYFAIDGEPTGGPPTRIRRANLDGTLAETLVTEDSHLLDLALDQPTGKMYWSTFSGTVYSIRRANLDGTGVESVVSTPGNALYLDVDSAVGKVYWFSPIEDPAFFLRANSSGSGSETVFLELEGRIGHDGIAVHGSCCQLYGDMIPGGHGIIDVDDLSFVLTAFVNVGDDSVADIAPCGGDGQIDVDDILAALQAFTGYFSCPGPCE